MRRKTIMRQEKAVLRLLDELPVSDEVFAGYWMHEATIALMLFGSQTGGAIRKARRLLKRLEGLGFVERHEWELGVSWRLAGRS